MRRDTMPIHYAFVNQYRCIMTGQMDVEIG